MTDTNILTMDWGAYTVNWETMINQYNGIKNVLKSVLTMITHTMGQEQPTTTKMT